MCNEEIGVTVPGFNFFGHGSLLQPAKLCLYNNTNYNLPSEKQFVIEMGTTYLWMGSGNVDASIWPSSKSAVSVGCVYRDGDVLKVRLD
jgi:hypothetical protein